jgi:hypothetical protein
MATKLIYQMLVKLLSWIMLHWPGLPRTQRHEDDPAPLRAPDPAQGIPVRSDVVRVACWLLGKRGT